MWLFLSSKILLILEKPVSFFENEIACVCTTERKYFMPQMSIMQFNTLALSLRFSKQGTEQYYLHGLYTKLKLSKTYLDKKTTEIIKPNI